MNIAENRLVTLSWSEIVGAYNNPDTVVQMGSRKSVME